MPSIIPLLTEYEKQHSPSVRRCPRSISACPTPRWRRALPRRGQTLGSRLVILGHHYQRDEVIRFADYTGDSFRLARQIASRPEADYIVFCGVHFMAESADVLCAPHQQVILPDLAAGCSMADMAEPGQLETAWEELTQMGITGVVPVTYINSAASIKAFVGERGGTVCTSSNAAATLKWAFARGERVLFLPDQHLGRNTAYKMGMPLDQMQVWDPHEIFGGLDARAGAEREDAAVEGPLLGAHALHREADRRRAQAASRHPRHRAPRGAVGRGAGGRRQRQHRVHHQDRRRTARRGRCGQWAPRCTW